MLYAVLSGYLLAALAPWLAARLKNRSGWVLALLPLSLTVYFASYVPAVRQGDVLLQSWAWFPALDVNMSFMLDGLSLLFALLISFIGTLIVVYSGAYLKDDSQLGRFYLLLLSFMASMLGLVLSDNLISLFVFWELTSVTSYLLIGFYHQDQSARQHALQGFLITAGGGLALMAGLILLALVGDSYQLSELLSGDQDLLASGMSVAMILCLLVGAFTKSAQFPFHFWLPNAMVGPSPVSAYLHSATMVKAGVYLMARLNPALGDHPLWSGLLCSVGALTMALGAWLAYTATDIKRVLAYSTVMALGVLTLLIGVGTDYALLAFSVFLLAHALYKGALFMLAGALEHETGTRDLQQLAGLRHAMPVSAAVAVLAGLSLAGLPPLLGFVAKELMLEGVLAAPRWGGLLTVVTLLASALILAMAAVVVIKPFWGARRTTPESPHEAPLGLLLGPAVLAVASLVFGLWPAGAQQLLVVTRAAGAAVGTTVETQLALWHGLNLPLLLSLGTLIGGAALYWVWSPSRQLLGTVNRALARWGPEAIYWRSLDALVSLASWQSRTLQSGVLGYYMVVLVTTVILLVGYTMLTQYGFRLSLDFAGLHVHEVAIALVMVSACGYVVRTPSRLGAVATVGALGFAMALVFMLFSAPDLGITQVLVETLTVILLVLVLYKLPRFISFSRPFERWRDATVAVGLGSLMSLLVLAAIEVRYFETISSQMVAASYPEAQGRNIVNVILVDFRALDTLGEIFVLSIAALGVRSMLKLRPEVNN